MCVRVYAVSTRYRVLRNLRILLVVNAESRSLDRVVDILVTAAP